MSMPAPASSCAFLPLPLLLLLLLLVGGGSSDEELQEGCCLLPRAQLQEGRAQHSGGEGGASAQSTPAGREKGRTPLTRTVGEGRLRPRPHHLLCCILVLRLLLLVGLRAQGSGSEA